MKASILLALGGCFLARLSPAAEPSYDFECDTPAGHYSYWSRTISHGTATISGTITVNEKRADPRWNPTITAMFYLESGKSGFGLQIFMDGIAKDVFFLRITQPGSTKETPFGTIPSDTKSIPFTVSLDQHGMLQVSVAGQSGSEKIEGFRPKLIQLSCSTGDIEFKNVTVSERS
jgi:hypothetical protein